MSHLGVHLKAVALEGWRALTRAHALWALSAAAVLLGAGALFMQVPLRDPGVFTLGAVALVDQLLVLMLVAVAILNVRPAAPAPWWPCAAETALVVRGLGLTLAVAVAAAAVVAVQYLMALIADDIEALVPLAPPRRLDADYAQLAAALTLYATILMSWGQVLRLALGAGAALLTLLLLVFTGYVLPALAAEGSAWGPLAWVLPDLGSIAPVRIIEQRGSHLEASCIMYTVTHAAMVWVLGAIVLRIQWDRGRSVDIGA